MRQKASSVVCSYALCRQRAADRGLSIEEADFIIADLTGKNANVFYEVGICHALEKLVLLLAQSMDDVPFDLRHRRVLLYRYTPKGCKWLESSLRDHVKSITAKLT
jgi:hypothetical protein